MCHAGGNEQRTVHVTGGQLSSIPQRRIKAYFENPQNGGGPTDDIKQLTDTSLLITFSSAQGIIFVKSYQRSMCIILSEKATGCMTQNRM